MTPLHWALAAVAGALLAAAAVWLRIHAAKRLRDLQFADCNEHLPELDWLEYGRYCDKCCEGSRPHPFPASTAVPADYPTVRTRALAIEEVHRKRAFWEAAHTRALWILVLGGSTAIVCGVLPWVA